MTEDMVLINQLGLHARAAKALVDTTQAFQSEIDITYNDQKIHGKSVLSVLSLGAPYGSHLIFDITGPDQKEAMIAIRQLISNRFGEEE